MELRVSTGVFKGRRLHTPRSSKPAMDKVKQSIVNILRNRINDANVLDLFSGVGNLGIELLSNGANEVVFVEKDRGVSELITKNLEELEVHPTRYTVINNTVKSYLKTNLRKFDLIVIDPYYKLDIKSELRLIPNFITAESRVILLMDKQKIYNYEGLELIESRTYGQTKVDFLKKSDII